MDELVGTGVGTAVARSGHATSTIQNVLDRQVDLLATALPGNLDTVRQCTEGSVGPARAAVLGDVLVQRVCQVRRAVHIAPIKVRRQFRFGNVRVRQRGVVLVRFRMAFQDLHSETE